LQPHQWAIDNRGAGLGELCFTNAGRPLNQHWFFQCRCKANHSGDAGCANIAGRFKRILNGFNLM
jgi:hypothetical protein